MSHLHRSVWARGSWALVLAMTFLQSACSSSDEGHPDAYEDALVEQREVPDPCASPKEGCSCDVVGEISDCGRVTINVDGYESCFDGSRVCAAEGTWGACVPDQQIVDAHQ